MNSGTGLISASDDSLPNYFRQQLEIHVQALNPKPAEDTRWYLGNLLVRFCRSDNFFAYENGGPNLRPLALLYGDAVEARNEYERCQLLQQLGDLSLFLGALFPQHYTRRGIRLDYLVGMGCSAYDYLADNARRGRHIFSELAGAFSVMLELVANACSTDQELPDENLLALYERWHATRDTGARCRLQAAGISLDEGERVH